ncbi:hypothetical protein DEU56DRAFT_952539 [Suillus clintonianus]|uniref:uncharacterized protein n=1 Tax=Suillus clintonianus TaxID=1904413 RepID=UPI001B863CDE|nr:uncharacterized protein DEU56DRAFT_952539 [Suillus clintonianus]KAG2132327.1 hypothetical protein DEU56DRAFT_952539 [Suillus clintonianus]
MDAGSQLRMPQACEKEHNSGEPPAQRALLPPDVSEYPPVLPPASSSNFLFVSSSKVFMLPELIVVSPQGSPGSWTQKGAFAIVGRIVQLWIGGTPSKYQGIFLFLAPRISAHTKPHQVDRHCSSVAGGGECKFRSDVTIHSGRITDIILVNVGLEPLGKYTTTFRQRFPPPVMQCLVQSQPPQQPMIEESHQEIVPSLNLAQLSAAMRDNRSSKNQ